MKNTCMIAFVAAFTVNLFVSCAPRGAGKAAFPGTGAGSDSGSSAQTTLVSSGTSDRGGGGRGVLCKRDGKSTVELLDLYEAKSMYGLHLIDAPADWHASSGRPAMTPLRAASLSSTNRGGANSWARFTF